MTDPRPEIRAVCVVLVPPGVPETVRSATVASLARRGFETFADLALSGAAAAAVPEPFRRDGARALVAFDPLVAGGEERRRAAVSSAVYHLGSVLGADARGLKVPLAADRSAAIVTALLPEAELDRLRDRIALRRREMETPEPVLADLSRFGHRAKVELVEWNGRRAVRKTFRATAGPAMRNEQALHDDIAPLSPVPARLLARTGNALLLEHVESRPLDRRILGRSLPTLMPMRAVGDLVAFARLVTSRGWDPIDLTPRDNVLIDRRTGALRCIDFEFAVRGDAPVPLETARFLSGLPADDPAAAQFDAGMRDDPYPGKWRPYTGLSRRSLLFDPPWLQRVKRAVVHPLWLIARAVTARSRRRAYLARRAAILADLGLEEGR